MKIPATAAKHVATIDYETYYAPDFTLSKLTTAEYIYDPRFEQIGVGVKLDGGPAHWLTPEQFLAFCARAPWDETAVLAHHAHFDGLILSHHNGVKPAFWFDTLSMARAVDGVEVGGSLKKQAEKYNLGAKGTEVVNALGKRRRDFLPQEYAAYGEYCKNDCDLEWALFNVLKPRFSDSEFWSIDTTIRAFTEPVLLVDAPLLVQFAAAERQKKADLLSKIAADKDTLMSNDQFAEYLAGLGVDPPRKISAKTGKETWAFAKTDPGMKELLDHERDEVRWATEARVGVKSTINETRAERFIRTSGNGTRPLPIYLKYCGAHTGRWSGGDKMNLQNLVRGGTLRQSLRAPPGSKVVVVDSGQIEARKCAWLAGHTDLLEGFRKQDADPKADTDVYTRFASTAYGTLITKKDKVKRGLGKTSILGLGYGMGWYKFAMTLAAGPMGAAPIIFTMEDAEKLNVDLDGFRLNAKHMARVAEMPSRLALEPRIVHCACAEKLVSVYRTENAPIAKLWKAMDAVMRAMDDETMWGKKFGPLGILRHALVLPTGRVLKYPGLSQGDDGWSCLGGRAGKERVRVYGGLLTENVVQAMARDVIAEQALHLRAEGFRIATTTHDEVVMVVPEADAARVLEVALTTLRTAPEWAPGLPLNAEGDIGDAYGDAK